MSNKCLNRVCGRCSTCCKLVKTTAVYISCSTLQLAIPAGVYKNGEEVCILVAQDIPVAANSNMNVTILINGSTVAYQMLGRNGNRIYADQIKSRRIYPTTVATDTLSYMYNGNMRLCTTSHMFNRTQSVVLNENTINKNVSTDVKEITDVLTMDAPLQNKK